MSVWMCECVWVGVWVCGCVWVCESVDTKVRIWELPVRAKVVRFFLRQETKIKKFLPLKKTYFFRLKKKEVRADE